MSLFSPVGSPGVLDNPILLAAALGTRAIADDCHCVIHFHGGVAARAVSLPQYSTDVGVEAIEVGIDRDSDGLSAYDFADSVIGDEVLLDLVGVIEPGFISNLIPARVLLVADVAAWVVIPLYNSVFRSPLISIEHPAAVAGPVHIVTVH